MKTIAVIYAALIVLSLIIDIYAIGKPRKPRTETDVVLSFTVGLVILVLLQLYA